MEDRLSRACARIDNDTVIVESLERSHFGDEVEHPLVLLCAELRDLVEPLDVVLRDDEQVRRRLRVDVADCDEAFGGGDVVTLAIDPAEQTVVRQR
jgi:hypothetical protein